MKDGKSELHSYHYKSKIWDEAAAKKHCQKEGGDFKPAKDPLPKRDIDEIIGGVLSKLDNDDELFNITKDNIKQIVAQVIEERNKEDILIPDPEPVVITLSLANGTKESLTKSELKHLITTTVKAELGQLD